MSPGVRPITKQVFRHSSTILSSNGLRFEKILYMCNVVHRETAHHRETAQTRSNRFSGIAQLFLGSDFWGNIIHVCCLRRPSRQGPMRVATEIISGKYMVQLRRFLKEIYL